MMYWKFVEIGKPNDIRYSASNSCVCDKLHVNDQMIKSNVYLTYIMLGPGVFYIGHVLDALSPGVLYIRHMLISMISISLLSKNNFGLEQCISCN